MAEQLAFVIVTPYTIRKSRTGAVLSRLLGRTSAKLIATQMLSPTAQVAAAFAAGIGPGVNPGDEEVRQLIREYIRENFSPGPDGRRRRIMLLVFQGPDAYADLCSIVGRSQISSMTGETIRDTYGDLVRDQDGKVKYFEPAVVMASSPDSMRADLRLWLDFAKTQPALLERVCHYHDPGRIERTLVLIKPDSWREKSSRPGAVVDMFSRTGLRIICAKLCRMSVAQGMEFYGPVRQLLREKLAPGIGRKARDLLRENFTVSLGEDAEALLATLVGIPYAEDQFERIIEFMTGTRPSECPPAERTKNGKVQCLALVYEGPEAVRKIRDVLGPTDPTKAPGGTVRREFGSDIMVNTGHASDSGENAEREIGVLEMRESNLVPIVEQALAECFPPLEIPLCQEVT